MKRNARPNISQFPGLKIIDQLHDVEKRQSANIDAEKL